MDCTHHTDWYVCCEDLARRRGVRRSSHAMSVELERKGEVWQRAAPTIAFVMRKTFRSTAIIFIRTQ